MGGFLVTRSLRVVLTMLCVVTLTFILGRLSGDPVAMMMPQTATAEDIARTRAQYGLAEPLPTQYVIYLRGLIQGDLGTSINFNRPALDVVLERIPATVALGVPALLISIWVGIPLGVLAAYHRERWIDRLTMSLSLISQSLPSFSLGIALILFFGVTLRWLPTFGSDTPAHYVLPTITLAIYPLAIVIRLTRAAMLEVLSEDYIRTAYAKGVRRRGVMVFHALRNALIPIVTVVGLQVASILSGAAIVETVFAWPGMGSLAVQAIGGRDYPVVQAVVLVSALAFSLTNLGVDLVYLVLDPRIQWS